jgi:hypothetical protein
MVSVAAASLVRPFLPLTAGQILLNNFLSDARRGASRPVCAVPRAARRRKAGDRYQKPGAHGFMSREHPDESSRTARRRQQGSCTDAGS